MSKKACKLKKSDKKKDKKKLKKIAEDPRFVCKKCGCKTHKKKHVCKPEKLKFSVFLFTYFMLLG